MTTTANRQNGVIIIRCNPLSPKSEARYIASIGYGPYMHGRITTETLWQEDDESESQLYSRAARRADELNKQAGAQ